MATKADCDFYEAYFARMQEMERIIAQAHMMAALSSYEQRVKIWRECRPWEDALKAMENNAPRYPGDKRANSHTPLQTFEKDITV